jgi:kanamycin nucleotidyltransferase
MKREKSIGPQAFTREERRQRIEAIAGRIREHFEERLFALGVYGSVARGSDKPHSDVEMFCVLREGEVEEYLEWTEGPWKAEVDVYGTETVKRYAAEVDGDWAMTHGAYTHVLPLYDPENFFQDLRELVFSQPDETFEAAIAGVLVGEIYEMIGKVRNIEAGAAADSLVFYLVQLALYGAWLVGLANRCLYTSSSTMLSEALAQEGLPAGFEPLCRAVISGQLAAQEDLFQLAEGFWAGCISWAAQRGTPIIRTLDQLLADTP